MLRLARSMFAMADEDNSGEVSRDEFTQWASKNLMSNRLLRAFNKAKKTSAGQAEKQGGASTSAGGSGAGSGQQVRQLHRQQSSKFRAAARAARVTKNRKAKLLNTIATEQAMEQLTEVTAFDLGEVKRLRHVFGAVLEGTQHPNTQLPVCPMQALSGRSQPRVRYDHRSPATRVHRVGTG